MKKEKKNVTSKQNTEQEKIMSRQILKKISMR